MDKTKQKIYLITDVGGNIYITSDTSRIDCIYTLLDITDMVNNDYVKVESH